MSKICFILTGSLFHSEGAATKKARQLNGVRMKGVSKRVDEWVMLCSQPSMLKGSINVLTNKVVAVNEQLIAETVHKTIFEASRRKQNVLISDLAERDQEYRAFLDLCSEYMDTKPVLVPNE